MRRRFKMSCDRRCFDKEDKWYGYDDCITCPGRDSGPRIKGDKMKKYIIKEKTLDQYVENFLCSGPSFTTDKKDAVTFYTEDDAYLEIFSYGLVGYKVIEYEEE
jgi:hypothetical protein